MRRSAAAIFMLGCLSLAAGDLELDINRPVPLMGRCGEPSPRAAATGR